jgi:ATP-dependent RNA helicase RhlE
LAAQIEQNVKEYSKYVDINSMVIFGGVNQNPQVKKLRSGVDILIATPGRLLDLEGQGQLTLRNVEILVLDEADRMLDMGFARDIKRVLQLVPERRQNLLFSATFNKEIKLLATNLLDNPVRVEATPENTTAELVVQRAIRVDKSLKAELLIKIISEGDWSQVLVFTRTKHGANKLSQRLEKKRISSAAIHGNKSQGARTKALAGFKEGRIRVLVATDIAARGLDIPLLPHVVNYELPNVPEDYVHRIGRTGRAGSSGEALSLVSLDEAEYLRGIEKLLGEKLGSETVEGFEPTETAQEVAQAKKDAEDRKKEHQRNRSRNRAGGGRSSGGRGPREGKSRRR